MPRDTRETHCFPSSSQVNNSNLKPRLLVPIEKLENMIPIVSVTPLSGDIGTTSSVILDSIPSQVNPQISITPKGTSDNQRPNPVIQNQSLPGLIPGMDQQTSDLITSSTVANFISQIASNISTSLMNRAIANFTKNSVQNDSLSSLDEIGELVSGLSTLTTHLNLSIANMISANNQVSTATTTQIIIPPNNVKSSFTSTTLKSLLAKPNIQPSKGKENLPIIIDVDDGDDISGNNRALKQVRSKSLKNQRRKIISKAQVKQFINQG